MGSLYDDSSGYSDTNQIGIQVLSTPERIKQQYLNLIRTATSEILLVFPTVNAIQREHSIGILDELRNAVQRGVKIRMLSAEDDFIKDKIDSLRAKGIVVRRIETPTESKFKMLIVDKKVSLTIETRDDSRASFRDAIGLAVYSNSKPTVLPFVTIFESFWRETDLYEKARESDRIKEEFVNIAAHELRNPIMPILSGADLLKDMLELYKDRIGEEMYHEFQTDSQLIIRNASKLLKLSEDILQINRIESGTFVLNLELVDLNSLIMNSIADIEERYAVERPDVKIVFDSKLGPDTGGQASLFRGYCDPYKMGQTIFNILDNAVKFTEKGEIEVSAKRYDEEVIIQVRDTGEGIDPEVGDRLFEKFVSKSNGGTGIGLYLSKKIIEAHGGRIWATNNKDTRGATFSIAIPFELHSEFVGAESVGKHIERTSVPDSHIG